LIQKKQNRSHSDALPLRYLSACSFRSKVTFSRPYFSKDFLRFCRPLGRPNRCQLFLRKS